MKIFRVCFVFTFPINITDCSELFFLPSTKVTDVEVRRAGEKAKPDISFSSSTKNDGFYTINPQIVVGSMADTAENVTYSRYQ